MKKTENSKIQLFFQELISSGGAKKFSGFHFFQKSCFWGLHWIDVSKTLEKHVFSLKKRVFFRDLKRTVPHCVTRGNFFPE